MPSVLVDTQNQPRLLTRQKSWRAATGSSDPPRGGHPYDTGARPRPLALQPTLLVGDDGEVLPNQRLNVNQAAPQAWAHRGLTQQLSRDSSVSSMSGSASTITQMAPPDNGDRRYSALRVGNDGRVLENQPSPTPQIWAHRGLTQQFSHDSSVSSMGSSTSTITQAGPDHGSRQYSALRVGNDGKILQNQPWPSPQIWAHRGLTNQFSRESTSSVSSIISSATSSAVRLGNGDRRDSVDTQRSSSAVPELQRKKSYREIGTSWASLSIFDTPLPYAELCLTDDWQMFGRFLLVRPLMKLDPKTDNPATDPNFQGSIVFEIQNNVGHSTRSVPLLACISQSHVPGFMKGSEEAPPKTWNTKAIGNPKTVVIEITWPGYPDMTWRLPRPLDNAGLCTRSIAALIALSVHSLISAVEMHEKSLVIAAPYDPSLIGQKPLWRLGGGGTAVEKMARMNLVSLDWAYDNVFHPQFSLTVEG